MAATFTYEQQGWTPVAVAVTTNFTDAGYVAIQGAATPFTAKIIEIMVQGRATSSTVNDLLFARDSTVGATLSIATTLGTNAAHHPSTAAARVTAFNTASTKPQRSSTLALLPLSFNAFGGIIRWVGAPGEEFWMVGATASFGECSISAVTGSGVGTLSSSIVYEEQ